MVLLAEGFVKIAGIAVAQQGSNLADEQRCPTQQSQGQGTQDLLRVLTGLRIFQNHKFQYHHVETCQETVPEAIIAFLESTGFEDALRNAVSLGGDSDTLACITGGIAEAFYGMPQELQDEALKRLPEDIRGAYELFRENIDSRTH